MSTQGVETLEKNKEEIQVEQAMSSTSSSFNSFEKIQYKIKLYQLGKLSADVLISEMTFEDVKLTATSGPHQGKSVLWLLAYALREGKQKAFLAAWDKWKDQLALEDFRCEAQEGEDTGKSVLWVLAGAARQGKREVFMEVWEKWKKHITLYDLRSESRAGKDKGKSVLWQLAWAARSGKSKAFIAVWQKWKKYITLDDIRNPSLEGDDKGKTILWLLADVRPERFMMLWEKWEGDLTLDDLLCRAQEGPDKGKSVLILLAEWVMGGQSEGFMAVWEKWKNIITLDDLRGEYQEGQTKTNSILRILAEANINGRPEGFMAVWEKWQNDITRNDVCAHMLSGLARAVGNGYDKGFLAVWEKWQNEITLRNLCDQAQQSREMGIAILRSLSSGAASGRPKAFMAVWEKWKSEIVFDDLRGPLGLQDYILNALTLGAARGQPEPFIAVWEKCQTIITLDDIRTQARSWGISNLGFLASAVARGKPQAFNVVWERWKARLMIEDFQTKSFAEFHTGENQSVLQRLITAKHPCLEDIVTQLPGKYAFPEQASNQPSTLPPITTQLQAALGKVKINVMSLLLARNAFFDKLTTLKANPHPSNDDLISLQACAKKASDAGYRNAFYELGKYFIEHRRVGEARQSYALVPADSFHFAEVTEWLAQSWYHEAVKPGLTDEGKRKKYLENATTYALKCQPVQRITLLQKVAIFIITGKTECKEADNYIIPIDLLEGISEKMPATWCLQRFAEIKIRWELKQVLLKQDSIWQSQQKELQEGEEKLLEQEGRIKLLKQFKNQFIADNANSQDHVSSVAQQSDRNKP